MINYIRSFNLKLFKNNEHHRIRRFLSKVLPNVIYEIRTKVDLVIGYSSVWKGRLTPHSDIDLVAFVNDINIESHLKELIQAKKLKDWELHYAAPEPLIEGSVCLLRRGNGHERDIELWFVPTDSFMENLNKITHQELYNKEIIIKRNRSLTVIQLIQLYLKGQVLYVGNKMRFKKLTDIANFIFNPFSSQKDSILGEDSILDPVESSVWNFVNVA